MKSPEFPEEPVSPVFIDEHGDVSVFRSVAAAVAYIEPIDVRNREYCGYDSLGRLLDLSCFAGAVRISLAERIPTHTVVLLALLRSFLRASGDTGGDDLSDSLPHLVSRAEQYAE